MKFIVDTCAWIQAVSTKDTPEDLRKASTTRESQTLGDPGTTRREICSRLYNSEQILITPSLLDELQKQKNRLDYAEKKRLEQVIELLSIIAKTTSQPPPPSRDSEGLAKHDNAITNLNRKFPKGSEPNWKPDLQDAIKPLQLKFSELIRSIPNRNQKIYKNQENPILQKKEAQLRSEIKKLHDLNLKDKLEGLSSKENKEKKELEKTNPQRLAKLRDIEHKITPMIWTDMENAIHASQNHAIFITADKDILAIAEVLPLRYKRIQANPDPNTIPFSYVLDALRNTIEKQSAQANGLTQSKKIKIKNPQETAELERQIRAKGGKILHWTKTQKEILLPEEPS